MKKRAAFLIFGVVASGFVLYATAPHPTSPIAHRSTIGDPCRPRGVTWCALNPDVTAATTSTTICRPGWTATIRPSSSYTSRLERQQLAGRVDVDPAHYEEDHRLPLELGGAPADVHNLSPEPHPASYIKDKAENAAKREVCAGADLRKVQRAFVARWLAPYPGYAANLDAH